MHNMKIEVSLLLAPLCKGSCHSAVQHFRYCCEYQVKDVQNSTEFFGTVTEGLLAEVMAEAERFDAGDPSVLTADKFCVIWTLRVSRIIVVFETSKPCRKPAPFGKGAK